MPILNILGGSKAIKEIVIQSDLDFPFQCTATEQVGDAVYLLSSNQVRQANSSAEATGVCIGFIASKSSTIDCLVRPIGAMTGFSGLTVGDIYFLDDTPGQITNVLPTGVGKVRMAVGKAFKADTFYINVPNEYTVLQS